LIDNIEVFMNMWSQTWSWQRIKNSSVRE